MLWQNNGVNNMQIQDDSTTLDDFNAWVQSIEESYLCPYCGKIMQELRLCCGEFHSEKIGSLGVDNVNASLYHTNCS